jgi:hypothetical protein
MAMSPRRSFFPLALLAAAAATPAYAGPAVQASAEAERTDLLVGQPVRVVVHVRNCDAPPEVQAPRAAGLVIDPPGPPTKRPSLLAGLDPTQPGGDIPGRKLVEALRATRDPAAALDPDALKQAGVDPKAAADALADLHRDDYDFTYLVRAEKPGALTLPGFTVKAAGQTATTQPVAFTVADARPSEHVRLALSLSDPTPLPDEDVKLYIDVLIRRGSVEYGGKTFPHLPVKDVALDVPEPNRPPELEAVKPLEQVVREHAPPPKHRGYRVNAFPVEAVPDYEPPDALKDGADPQWYRRRLEVPLRVGAAGSVVLPPARVAGEVYLGPAAPGGKERWEKFVAASEPLTITIRDLPNRPPDYTGGVGQFRLTAKASLTKMAAGTPFTLTLRQEGTGSLGRATAPELTKQPGFDRFAVRPEGDRLASDQAREFTYTLRPRDAAVKEVPAVSQSYYNPKADRFETARSEPIPLEVTPGAAFTLPDAADPSAPANAPPAAAVRPGAGSWAGALLFWGGLNFAVVLAAAGLLLAARRWRRFRAGRAARVERRQAVHATLERLRADHLLAAEVREAVQDFLRTQLGLPPGEVTPQDAEERLTRAGYDPALARDCAAVLRDCEAAAFAPGVPRPAAADLAAAAERVVRAVLAARPAAAAPAAVADEVTRERAAAVAG